MLPGRQVYKQDWFESEKGWGTRPDGCSFHTSIEDCNSFITQYWLRMPDEVPREYSRPCGKPYPLIVSAEIYFEVTKSGEGLRLYEHALREMRLVEKLAEEYAAFYHQGQTRKGSKQPYIIHPRNVVRYLRHFGVENLPTIAIGWLHDTLEDTELTYGELVRAFGSEISAGVYLLTRNIDEKAYKQRLSSASRSVKLVKLCDTLDNIRTLECLDEEGIQRKVNDCMSFYIPMACEINPAIAARMSERISRYKTKYL